MNRSITWMQSRFKYLPNLNWVLWNEYFKYLLSIEDFTVDTIFEKYAIEEKGYQTEHEVDMFWLLTYFRVYWIMTNSNVVMNSNEYQIINWHMKNWYSNPS